MSKGAEELRVGEDEPGGLGTGEAEGGFEHLVDAIANAGEKLAAEGEELLAVLGLDGAEMVRAEAGTAMVVGEPEVGDLSSGRACGVRDELVFEDGLERGIGEFL